MIAVDYLSQEPNLVILENLAGLYSLGVEKPLLDDLQRSHEYNMMDV
jgi:hypothetical protein